VIKAIKFVGVPVSDQQRALDFYTKTLGFRVVTDQPFDDKQRWIELGIGRSSSGLTLFTPDGQENRIGTFTGISFVADDVMETCKELASKGVTFIQEPQKADWGTAAVWTSPGFVDTSTTSRKIRRQRRCSHANQARAAEVQ
jgi:catechol 2,3-dioxygenase-like lactoylglutathione lyase family enzyme